ncbi:MAG: diaminopimelate decarboxylase [Spirochaetota bacterium]
MDQLKFLSPDQVREIATEFSTPVFVYSQSEIEKSCDKALAFPNEYGLKVRYAMKANPNAAILKIMQQKGIGIDASSEFEVERALKVGFAPQDIMLTSQQLAKNLQSIVEKGVFFNACSLHQLQSFGELFPGKELSIRINPGLGSGATQKTDVGGVTSSFGIWHEHMDKVKEIVAKYQLRVTKIHTHIGSGSDPEVWKAVSKYSLEYAALFSECHTVNLGGGYKVGRMPGEKSTDPGVIGSPVKEKFIEFFQKFQRKLTLEIEPGTFFVANAGSIIASVDDKVDTGSKGFEFIKLDAGMDTNTRPSLYAAEHPFIVVPAATEATNAQESTYVVVGHCCESGDVFTQKMGGEPVARKMSQAEVGDFVVIEGCGAYCSSMSTKNYNSFPEAAEVLLNTSGKSQLIRQKQTLEQIIENEIDISI